MVDKNGLEKQLEELKDLDIPAEVFNEIFNNLKDFPECPICGKKHKIICEDPRKSWA